MNEFVLTPVAEGDLAEIVEYVMRGARLRLFECWTRLRTRCNFSPIDPASDIFARTWPETRFFSGPFSPTWSSIARTDPLQIIRVLRGKRDVRRLLDE